MSINQKYNNLHTTSIQVRFNDIDIMAHVNNSVYQNYFDTARMKYFEEVFQQKMDWKKRTLILAKITIEYINPIFLEEKIIVQSKIHTLGNKSIQMVQEIINSETNEIKAKNEAVLVAFDVIGNKPISLPNDWRTRIQQFEKDIFD